MQVPDRNMRKAYLSYKSHFFRKLRDFASPEDQKMLLGCDGRFRRGGTGRDEVGWLVLVWSKDCQAAEFAS